MKFFIRILKVYNYDVKILDCIVNFFSFKCKNFYFFFKYGSRDIGISVFILYLLE